jgi:hypothetical protein
LFGFIGDAAKTALPFFPYRVVTHELAVNFRARIVDEWPSVIE